MDRYVQIVHALPGRVRLRVAALRNRREECAAAAEAVARLPGVADVRTDPFTGSFLVRYDEARVEALALASALRAGTGARGVLLRGEQPPLPPLREAALACAVGRALYQVFREVNEDLLRRTGGGLDLGVVVTAAFFGIGAAEVVASRKIPPPPWFNLAWWGFQTFMSSEGAATHAAHGEGSDGPGSPG